MTQKVSIDLDRIRDISRIGARRASAFLTIANSRRSPSFFKNFSLKTKLGEMRFWPSPIEQTHAEKAVHEFDSWIVGVCLREVHLHFDLFLNEVWQWGFAIKKHGARIPSDYVLFDSDFFNTSSVSVKYEKACELLGQNNEALGAFRSLHYARNCLSHGAGYVRKRDCNEDGLLVIRWLKLKVYLGDAKGEIPIQDAIKQQYRVAEGDGDVFGRFEWNELSTPRGKKLVILQDQVAEIAYFYTSRADQLMARFRELLVQVGATVLETKKEA